jgi:hypothetical protein
MIWSAVISGAIATVAIVSPMLLGLFGQKAAVKDVPAYQWSAEHQAMLPSGEVVSSVTRGTASRLIGLKQFVATAFTGAAFYTGATASFRVMDWITDKLGIYQKPRADEDKNALWYEIYTGAVSEGLSPDEAYAIATQYLDGWTPLYEPSEVSGAVVPSTVMSGKQRAQDEIDYELEKRRLLLLHPELFPVEGEEDMVSLLSNYVVEEDPYLGRYEEDIKDSEYMTTEQFLEFLGDKAYKRKRGYS